MRNPKHTFFSLVFLCFLFMPGYTTAQEEEYLESQEPPLTLRWVVEEAVDNNPDIRASLNRWEASQEAIDAARSLDDPRAGFQIRNAKSPIQVEGPGWNRYRRMGGVSQKIP
ncbi:MAG: TolC family protein, partial [Candidatus Brocadiales bacterium]|nr:TolC family protein [Candidatus Bathyanammoxibius sp.]